MNSLRKACLTALGATALTVAAPAQAEIIAEDILQGVTISGLIEVNAWQTEDYAGVDSSDLTLATVELAIDAQVHKWVSGHLVLLFEEDDTEDLTVDVGYIRVGNLDHAPYYLDAGRMYLFGGYETNMISDPLTLEIGETQVSALKVGFDVAGAYGSLYAYNGDTQKNEDDKIENFGANLGYAYENNGLSLDVGIDYTSNLLDSGLVMDNIADAKAVDDYVGAMIAHATLNIGGFNFIAEYLTALDPIKEITFNGTGAEPTALNVEAAYTAPLLAGKDVTFAVGYQTTEEALGLGLAESRILVGVGVGIFDNTSLKFEWKQDTDYETGDGGTGEDANTFTVQLAVEF
ncbi:LbtU family siderophore porin [Candidatus Albibeggiatoa sp. nov. NOAA]|uniref:LbtU family siderophore porin n=1 Tax=Candidatus Albibeggiatoa sp. nov. NOAA TaxID=3162724 RepID=UPI0032F21832|nr:LbtU family siderophore porin [Thiotrichaceae bacterium]